jgi:pimeloyl-ACP methyl ester carboxylesterase
MNLFYINNYSCQAQKKYNYLVLTIILPGYSAHNKIWLEETARDLNAGGEVRAVYWDHWTDPTKKFNAEEKGRLLNDISGAGSVDIIAKSIGTLVASYMILASPEKIRKVIFCGIPMNDLTEEDKEVIKLALKSVPPKQAVCFQNDEDPHGSSDQLTNFLSGFDSGIEIVSKSRSDHEYPLVEEFRKFLLGFSLVTSGF